MPLVGEDREDVQNIHILISDGGPENPDALYTAESTTIQVRGIGKFVVCLRPGCTLDFAKGIASPAQKVSYTTDVTFQQRPSLREQLMGSTSSLTRYLVSSDLFKYLCLYNHRLPVWKTNYNEKESIKL